MPDYKETTVTGTAYIRANQVVVANPLEGVKAVSYYEEQVVNLEDDQIIRPQGGIQEPFTQDNASEEFDLVDPVDGTPLGMTMEYKDLYVALHSLYLHLAAKRDAAATTAAVPPVEPTPEV